MSENNFAVFQRIITAERDGFYQVDEVVFGQALSGTVPPSIGLGCTAALETRPFQQSLSEDIFFVVWGGRATSSVLRG